MTQTKEETIGYGCEGEWAMQALRDIVDLAKSGKLNQDPYHKESPNLSPEEAEAFGKLMESGKIKVKITPFDAFLFMKDAEPTSNRRFYQISMRADVAAVVVGIAGFDEPVYLGHNKDLVTIVKKLSQDPSGLLKTPIKQS